jgi:acyl-CoA synthetase (AMP-forming)/AMP-acid ligase II
METWAELTAEGAPFAWSETEVRGMTMRTFDAAPPNMRVLWESSAAHGDATYLVYEDESYTYAEAHAIVRALAEVLYTQHGVRAGDRVAIAMRNFPEWVFSYWAISSLGAAAVGMNAWWTGQEMSFGLIDSEPKVLICDEERLERVIPLLPELRADRPMHVMSVRTDLDLPDDATRWEDVIDPASAPDALPDADIQPDDDMCIFYTSGTTGFPKGAQLTHRGCLHNLLHMAFNTAATAMTTAKLAAADAPSLPEPRDPAIMVPTPLFHVTANNCVLHPGTALGAKVVLMRKWDPARALELIERENITIFTGVPTMSREMLLHADWETRDTSSLESMGGGGAALQPDLVDKIDKAAGDVKPQTGYGLTETHGIITAISAAFFTAEPASAGPIMPTFEHKVIDEDGNEVAAGGFGELVVKGPAVVKGYLNRPDATAESMPEGWFRTGDIVTVDENGFVFIVDRVKDMVIRGGENIYCSEVEAAIYEHPEVAEAAAFGVDDERLGEKVAVAIFRTPGATLDEARLSAHLTDRIAKFKHPEVVHFVDEPLPQNANGKFLKRELRETLS